jgi:D-3-phosphoglycerate dehydrogenase
MKVLITCPKLIQNLDKYGKMLTDNGITYFAPRVIQQLPKEDLLKYVPEHDGWIAGDDPANREILTAGRKGKLRALVKWGVGIDNVDQKACKDLGIQFSNTPGVFGNEVADIAMGYLINLSRKLHIIDREVRKGNWLNIPGFSLQNKRALVIGFGDIGHNMVERLQASKVNVSVYDPYYEETNEGEYFNKERKIVRSYKKMKLVDLKEELPKVDIVICCCELNIESYHIINEQTLSLMKDNACIVNVARGDLVDIKAVMKAMRNGKLKRGYAADVFEVEPYGEEFELMAYTNCIMGTHNASNTVEAVERTSVRAIDYIVKFLK